MTNKTTALVATTALLAGGVVAGTAGTASAAQGTGSLATVLAADGSRLDHNWRDFDIVEKAVTTVLTAKPDSPVGVVADGSVRLTAFLPTDAAFRRLVTSLTGKRPATERATFNKIAATVDVDTLEAVLLYHVVPGATVTAAKARKSDGARLTTAAGPTLRVNVTRQHAIRLVDKDPDAANARVVRSKANLNQGNRQIAHGVTKVLRPADL